MGRFGTMLLCLSLSPADFPSPDAKEAAVPEPADKKVTSSRVTPDGLRVCVCVCFVVQSQKPAQLWCQHICSGDVLEGGARSSRGVTCDGVFCAFCSGFEHIFKQAFNSNFAWTTMSNLFARTCSGVLRKAMKGKLFGFSIAQGGPVPEDILVWYVFDVRSTPNMQK